jgi:hypothetical protein
VKPLLLIALIAVLPTLQQVEREEPELQVVKFGWAREKPKSRMIRGAQNPGGSITTPISDAPDQGTRGVDLRAMEKKAVKSANQAVDNNYQVLLELKNTGANVVKGVIWEYRATAGPEDYQPKQYLCALQMKPKEKKILDIWTPYLPVKVISAEERKDLLKDGTVIINQIEYADGSVWKKRGWNYKLPADSLQKLTDGQCSVF